MVGNLGGETFPDHLLCGIGIQNSIPYHVHEVVGAGNPDYSHPATHDPLKQDQQRLPSTAGSRP